MNYYVVDLPEINLDNYLFENITSYKINFEPSNRSFIVEFDSPCLPEKTINKIEFCKRIEISESIKEFEPGAKTFDNYFSGAISSIKIDYNFDNTFLSSFDSVKYHFTIYGVFDE